MNARNARDRKEERRGEEEKAEQEAKRKAVLIQWRGRETVYGDGINHGGIYKRVGENSGGTWVALNEGYAHAA